METTYVVSSCGISRRLFGRLAIFYIGCIVDRLFFCLLSCWLPNFILAAFTDVGCTDGPRCYKYPFERNALTSTSLVDYSSSQYSAAKYWACSCSFSAQNSLNPLNPSPKDCSSPRSPYHALPKLKKNMYTSLLSQNHLSPSDSP